MLTSMTTDCGDRDGSVTLTKTRGLLQQTHCSPTPVGQPAKTDAAAPSRDTRYIVMSPAASVAEHPDKFGPLAPLKVIVDVATESRQP
jgi:hypothetical protein